VRGAISAGRPYRDQFAAHGLQNKWNIAEHNGQLMAQRDVLCLHSRVAAVPFVPYAFLWLILSEK
jgi:hypothetical protein